MSVIKRAATNLALGFVETTGVHVNSLCSIDKRCIFQPFAPRHLSWQPPNRFSDDPRSTLVTGINTRHFKLGTVSTVQEAKIIWSTDLYVDGMASAERIVYYSRNLIGLYMKLYLWIWQEMSLSRSGIKKYPCLYHQYNSFFVIAHQEMVSFFTKFHNIPKIMCGMNGLKWWKKIPIYSLGVLLCKSLKR